MNLKQTLLILGLTLQVAACASKARQTEELVRGSLDIPPAHNLENLPFENQSEGYCGPAALTMAMRAAGSKADVDKIAPLVMTESQKGSLPMDMIAAARREGMMAVEIDGLSHVATEVANGTPVIVFQNLGFSWLSKWHYAVVTGYDIPRQEVILHTGDKAFKREPMRHFERSWELAESWAIVILPPGKLARTAGELAHLKAAAGLEQVARLDEAATAYDSLLQRWPESLGPLVGLANISYARADYKRAVHLLRKASMAHPESLIARHNLEVAEKAFKSIR